MIARNKELLGSYLANILSFKLLLSIIALIVGIVITVLLGYQKQAILIFSLIMINQLLISFILYLRSNISASGKYRWDSIISVIDKFLLILILGVMLYTSINNGFSIYYYIFSQTAVFALVLLVVLIININLAQTFSLNISKKFIKELLRSSLPYSYVIIMMAIYMRIDGFLLERILPSPYQAGVYAAAYRIFEAFNNLGYLFAVLLLPMFASLLANKQKLVHLISTSHDLLLVISATASVVTILFSEEIMNFIYPLGYNESYSKVLILLMISFFSVSMNYIYGTFLTAAGRVSLINKTVFTAVVINVSINLILIPIYGAKGAAFTSIITQYFVLSVQYYLTIKYLQTGFDYKTFIKRLLFILILVSSGLLLRNISGLSWYISALVTGFISLSMAYLGGFIKFSDLKREL
jgi:O-antigen/teichoic acid export membrane protein